VDVLLNPQLNVVEFGDGTGSIDYWSILFSQVCYETEGAYVWSPSHSLTMSDGNCAASPDEDLVDDWDYDAFGQGFWAPAGLTYLSASYQRLYGDVDDYDSAVSSLWTLDSEGYLLEEIAAYTIGQTPDGWSPRQWALDSSGLEQASGQPLALVFYFWGDLLPPYEWIWLDDVQVTLCYDVGQYAVYLPLLAKQPPPPSQPTCSPREPDSLAQPGSTARDATCGGSFSPLDEKDYYLLDLRGHPRIRLRLFNLPPGTNWDALVYENTGGYPLACQIGTPGSGDKSADCNLDLGKDYFVLVSRGPNRTGGSYSMQAKTR
jgi:hypothetical protein